MALVKRKAGTPGSPVDPGLKAWLDAPQIMIWMTNERHQCVYGNEALLDYFGFSLEMIEGLNWLDTIHPEDRDRIRRNQEFAARNFQNFRQEYRTKGKGRADYIWVLDISGPRFDAAGNFLGYIGSVMDITQQKNQEEELKAAQKRLEREILQISDREQFRIGRDLHDEMSQHLLGIALKGMLLERKLKKRGLPEVSVVREMTEEINQAIAKTRKISQSLFPAAFSKKDLFAALEELAEKIRTSFGVSVQIQVSPERFNVDPEKAVHLYRIIQESVTNSVRHGRAENIVISIRNGAKGRSLLEVRDDGSGFPEAFQPSEGLGLQIMEYRAHMIEGRLELKPSETGGTILKCDYPS